MKYLIILAIALCGCNEKPKEKTKYQKAYNAGYEMGLLDNSSICCTALAEQSIELANHAHKLADHIIKRSDIQIEKGKMVIMNGDSFRGETLKIKQ